MSKEAIRRLWIVGFAGHRHLADPAAAKQAILASLREFREKVDGVLTGRSSAAAGADLLFLEACRELGVAYSVVLPFTEDRFSEDFENPEEWAKAKELIDRASNVEIAPGNEPAPEAYHLAAREIMDVSDAMLFLWDGQPARGIGGTGETVVEARERPLPYQLIAADTLVTTPLSGGTPLPWRDSEFSSLPAASSVRDLFEELDRRAIRGAPRSRWFAAGSISLNQIATVISGALIAFTLWERAAHVVKFVIVAAAAGLPWLGSRFHLDDTWTEDRLRAELLRSLLASHSFAPPLRPFAADLFLEDAPFLRSAAWQLIPERGEWETQRDRYLDKRLQEQIDYLVSKGKYAERRLKIYSTAFRISSIGALVLGGLAIYTVMSAGADPQGPHRIWLVFLPTILPAVAAWCLAMVPLFEHKRRAKLYGHMADQLTTFAKQLSGAKCRTTACAVVASCERLLLTELWEWAGTRGKRKR